MSSIVVWNLLISYGRCKRLQGSVNLRTETSYTVIIWRAKEG